VSRITDRKKRRCNPRIKTEGKMSAAKRAKNEPPRGLRKVGGKKLSQPGTEFLHKIKETRRHRTGGRPGGGPHRRG
jgi:hypothetical protein